jgi:pimeloyl-ACP methyl ester carboxylesterase
MRGLRSLLVFFSSTLIAAGTLSAQTPAPKSSAAGQATESKAAAPLNIAPDTAREQSIAETIVSRVAPADVLWLEVDGAKVLALYNEQILKKPRGAVLLLHGMDRNADDPALMRALRTALPKAGWSVLAVQLPVLPANSPREAYGGTVEAAAKRVQAALAELKKRKQLNIALVGQDLGAALALSMAGSAKDVRAVAALSLSSAEGLNPPVDVAAPIGKLKVPVLDMYGGFAEPAQHKLAEQRAAAARTAKHPWYSQVVIAGTDDMLTNVTHAVVIRVRAWLSKAAPGVALPPAAVDKP